MHILFPAVALATELVVTMGTESGHIGNLNPNNMIDQGT